MSLPIAPAARLAFTAAIPGAARILKTFEGFAKMPPSTLEMVINAIDSEGLQALAQWASTLASHMATLKTFEPTADDNPDVIIEPDFDVDFFETLSNVEVLGRKLSPQDLTRAKRKIDSAMKAEDWKRALLVGVSMGRLIV